MTERPQTPDGAAARRRCEEALLAAARKARAQVPAGTAASGSPDPLAAALEGLLRVRLPELAEARDYGSPDGVLIRQVDVASPSALEVRGWVIEVATQTCEPFAARVELTDDGEDLRGYVLAMGDAARRLQRLRLDSRKVRLGPPTVDEWLFTFSRDDAGKCAGRIHPH